MTPEQARNKFSEALDGDLSAQEQRTFDALLASHESLRLEYDDFVETIQLLGKIAENDIQRAPDLRSKIQERIRERSKGRFGRQGFSPGMSANWILPLIFIMVLVIAVAVGFFVLQPGMIGEDLSDPSTLHQPRFASSDCSS